MVEDIMVVVQTVVATMDVEDAIEDFAIEIEVATEDAVRRE